jgi:hypothetical protein
MGMCVDKLVLIRFYCLNAVYFKEAAASGGFVDTSSVCLDIEEKISLWAVR